MRSVFFLLFFIPGYLLGQIRFDFESDQLGGWLQFPPCRWEISSEHVISGSGSLKHIFDNPGPGTDRIVYPTGVPDFSSGRISWSFRIRYAYSPSSMNNWNVALLSSPPVAMDREANDVREGYVLGVNFRGNDDMVTLWALDGNGNIETLETDLNWQEEIDPGEDVRIRSTRDHDGKWTVEAAASFSTGDMVVIGSGRLPAVPGGGFFSILYRYTKSRDRGLWIDDLEIEGTFLKDTMPPVVLRMDVPDDRHIILALSEATHPGQTLKKENYFLKFSGHSPDSVYFAENASILLEFGKPFSAGQREILIIDTISDLSGNRLCSVELPFVYYHAARYDVVINEILSDPDPSAGLPLYEFIELYNRTDFTLCLKDWWIGSSGGRVRLGWVSIGPREYLLLCPENAAGAFAEYGKSFACLPSGGFLRKSGDFITMRNSSYELIHTIRYAPEWYSNEYFSSGGWSLEQIDPENYCGRKNNWKVSTDLSGGTPGRKNAVFSSNPDFIKPEIINLYLKDSDMLVMEFDEPMDSFSLIDIAGYHVYPENIGVRQVIPESPDFTRARIRLCQPVHKGEKHCLHIQKSVTDCAGNFILQDRELCFAPAEFPDSGDILINEVLFDAFPGEADFVEILNHSDKVVDLADVLVAKMVNGDELKICRIAEKTRLFFPGEYRAISRDPESLLNRYFIRDKRTLLFCPELFGLDDQGDHLMLMDRSGRILDEMVYSSSMHCGFIANTEGISLERISPRRPSLDKNNWFSAAETAGFATPGYENSQSAGKIEAAGEISIHPEIFSPDRDGVDDYLNICYHFPEAGQVGNIIVFDARGRFKRTVASNVLLSAEGVLIWDGLDSRGEKVPIGPYLLYIEILDNHGRKKCFKKTCVVAGKILK